jgi:hypothetical protein
MSAAASSNLETATRDLLIAWERAHDQWRDAKSQQFHHTFIEPVPDLVLQARDAMGHLEAILRKIKNDCE